MKSQYLCKEHFQAFSKNLKEAQDFWNGAMSLGLELFKDNNWQKAEGSFGSAYEIANIILDRQIANSCDLEAVANTLLAVQYLAVCKAHQGDYEKAGEVLQQVHDKFNFICQSAHTELKLRKKLSTNFIPYIEKLYCLTMGTSDIEDIKLTDKTSGIEKGKKVSNVDSRNYLNNLSTLYH